MSAVSHLLKQSLWQYQRRRMVQGVAWVLLVWGAVALLGVLAWRLGWLGLPNLTQVLGWMLPVGLLLLSVGLWLSRPKPLWVAQVADVRLGLHETLSTATEWQSLNPTNPREREIQQALLQQAEQKATSVPTPKVFGVRWPRVGWVGLMLFALSLGVLYWPATNPAENTLTPAQVTQATQELRQVAEVLRQDAEQNADPLLAATARAVERLQQQVEQQSLTPQELRNEVERLAQRIEQNYKLPAAANNPQSQQEAPVGSPEASAGDNPPNQVNSEAATAAPNLTRALSDAAERVEQQRQQKADSQNPPKTPPQQEQACGDNCDDNQGLDQYRAGAKAEAERRAKEQINKPAGGDAGGQADQAGQSSAPSANTPPSTPPTPPANTTQVAVQAQLAPSGDRIKLSAPPSLGIQTAGVSQGISARFSYQEEIPQSQVYIEARNREVVSRYFSPQEEP